MKIEKVDFPKYGLVIIDEIESSLHPRAQRRLIRDLANVARLKECQIIISTHSPYILEELPLEARNYILETDGHKEIAKGVSPQFAMSKMDDENHTECELYVEDNRAAIWLSEILSRFARNEFMRSEIVPYGAANLGVALGQLVKSNRFPRPTRVFLDGDQGDAEGCTRLPGDDAPERVVFNDLRDRNWENVWVRIGRNTATVTDECQRAMTLENHHEWVNQAATNLMCGGDVLWHAMCSEWVQTKSQEDVQYIIDEVTDALN